MSGSEDRPVADIEGIGPVRAQALASAGVRTVFDLLHVPEAILASAVSSLASPADVRTWVTAALLLQIDRMTPQWAQALVAAGVDSLGEIHRKRLDSLETLFAAARNSGLIPEVPTAATIAAMMTDAAILAHTGTIAGRVVDATGAAVAGATVYAGGASTRTDDRGRFRLARVPLAPGVRLRLEHPDHPALEVANPRIVADPEAIALRLYRLPAATGDSATPSAPLSELSGDTIPLGPGAPFREIVVAASSFSAGDLLRIVEISSDEMAVVSLLRRYEDGNVVVRKARLPRSSVQGDPARGGLLRVGPTGFELVSMSVKEIHRYRLHLRLARAFDGHPVPTTREEARALAMEKMKFLQDAGWFLHGAGGHQ